MGHVDFGNKITYSRRLREIMAARGMNNISAPIPLLTERGITLSASQIYRLVGDKPERISLPLPGALTDALDCTVEDLCVFRAEAAAVPKAVNAGPVVIDLNTTIRPKRARVRRTDRCPKQCAPVAITADNHTDVWGRPGRRDLPTLPPDRADHHDPRRRHWAGRSRAGGVARSRSHPSPNPAPVWSGCTTTHTSLRCSPTSPPAESLWSTKHSMTMPIRGP